MIIRKAKINDIKIIIDFQQIMAMETEKLVLDYENLNKGVKSVFDDRQKGIYYIAEENNKIIASLLTTYEWSDWRNKTIIWIQSVYVIPEYRKKSVFREMYSYIKNIVENNEEYAGIRLYVDKSNITAQKVYTSLGMNADHYTTYEYLKKIV
jgi:predicted GNAT family acetyltransferase